MSELISAVTGWQTLLTAILAFGLLPGVALRIAVTIYPREHPRRRELVAELHAVPRWERPFWVAEQLVTVAWEGIPERVRAVRLRLRGRATSSQETDADELYLLVSNNSRRDAYITALNTLSLEHRRVLVMRIGQGMTAEEVAQQLGTTPGAVRVAQHRALTCFRELGFGETEPQ